MKQTTKITVVVPVYNAEQYLRACLDSIVQQSYHNLEIILINDGSTDQSGEICDEYAALDTRVKVIHQANCGLGMTRNKAIKLARGEYLTFIDNDDLVLPEYIETLYSNAVKYQADLTMCLHQMFDQEPIELKKTTGQVSIVSNQEVLENFGFTQSKYEVAAWAKLYHKDIFTNCAFPGEHLPDDIATTYKIFDRANKIVYVDRVLYLYRNVPNSLGKSAQHKLRALKGFEEFLTFSEQRNIQNLNMLELYANDLLEYRKKYFAENFEIDLQELRTNFKRVIKLRRGISYQKRMKDWLLYLLWNVNYSKYYTRKQGLRLRTKKSNK